VVDGIVVDIAPATYHPPPTADSPDLHSHALQMNTTVPVLRYPLRMPQRYTHSLPCTPLANWHSTDLLGHVGKTLPQRGPTPNTPCSTQIQVHRSHRRTSSRRTLALCANTGAIGRFRTLADTDFDHIPASREDIRGHRRRD